LISSHKLHKKSLRKITFPLNDSNLIFTVSKDKSLKLTDLKHEQNILSIETAHDNPINCLTIIDHWLIATADDDGCVKIWDYRQKKATMETKECQDYISDLVVGNDKRVLLATSGEGTLTAFHTKKKKMILQSELIDSEMLCIAFMKVFLSSFLFGIKNDLFFRLE
jgi:WD40 repeat protein